MSQHTHAHYNEIFLDSSQRTGGTNNRPVWTLSSDFTNVVGVKVISAQIPFSFDTVTEGANYFQYRSFDPFDPDHEVFDIVVPPGSYTAVQLARLLQELIRTHVPRHNTDDRYMTVTYRDGRFDFSLYTTKASGYTPSYQIVFPSESRLSEILGFPQGLYESTEIPNPGGASFTQHIISVNYAIATGPRYLYLTSPLGTMISSHIRVNGGNETSDVLARIPISVGPGKVIDFYDSTPHYSFPMHDGQITSIELGLQAGPAREGVDLKGSVWSIVLAVFTAEDGGVVYEAMDQSAPVRSSKRRRR